MDVGEGGMDGWSHSKCRIILLRAAEFKLFGRMHRGEWMMLGGSLPMEVNRTLKFTVVPRLLVSPH